MTNLNSIRCSRCGRLADEQDKFCAECGMFLRDAFVDQRLLLALVHERDGRIPEARRELERLLATEPGNVLANHLLGSLCFHQGILDQAVQYYRKAITAAPTFVLGQYDLGVAYYHRGDMPEAAVAFRRCLEIDPHYNAAHYRLALALFHGGRLDEAREHFELSLALTPEYLMAHYHLEPTTNNLGVAHENGDELPGRPLATGSGTRSDSRGASSGSQRSSLSRSRTHCSTRGSRAYSWSPSHRVPMS